MAERINETNFKEKILTGPGLKIAEFYSDSCIPCKMMAPVLAELEETYPELYIGKLNAAYEQNLAEAYGVRSSPTLLFFKDGKEAGRVTGAVKKAQLDEMIHNYLG